MLRQLITVRRGLARAFMVLAGLFGAAILLLLCFNVVVRGAGANVIWVSEVSRLLFVWGAAIGMVSVSLAGEHFRVDLFSTAAPSGEEDSRWWELVLQLGASAVLAYIAWYAAPTIARAATQALASVPLDYGAFRLALVLALCGMCAAHLWRSLEIIVARLAPRKDHEDA